MTYFSVIMPAKNREKEIKGAIQSIQNQTFRDWELIVIDDHSTDQTAQIVKDLQDKKIKYYFLESGTGPGAGRDFGIRKAAAEIIVLADSDDISDPHRLELTLNAFQNHDVDIVYGLTKRLEIDGRETVRPSHQFNADLLLCYNYIPQPTVAFKKKCYLDALGYDWSLRTSEDYDLWLTFFEKNYKFYFINRPLVLQKIHPGSTTLQISLGQRKRNLAYVRQKHHLKTPNFENVKNLVASKQLLSFISTPKAIEFWFKD